MVVAVNALGITQTLLIAPIGQHLIVHDGWRTSAIAFVLIALIMALLGVLMGAQAS